MRALAFAALITVTATPIASCFIKQCECAATPLGLIVQSPAPITDVALSGPACDGARFRCMPADFDNTIHPDCTSMQIEPVAVGDCVVDVTAGGTTTHLSRRMREYPNCCDEPGTFLRDEDGWGHADLRDGGTGAPHDAATD